MTVQIKLKKKYLVGGKSRFKGAPKPAPAKGRTKLGQAAHIKRYGPLPPAKTLHINKSGKGVMRDA